MLVLPEENQYILKLHITTRKSEKGVLTRLASIDYREADAKGIYAGDTLTVKVIDHARSKVQEENQ